MSTIKKVAVAGASGSLGKHITQALLDAGFDVTAISRQDSSAKFPSAVSVKRADFSSVDSIAEAIRGQDAFVSALGTNAAVSGAQNPLVDAVIAAHVPRFVPSEFGVPTRNLNGHKIGKLLAGKIETTDRLIELSKKYDWFSWTGISNGLFFDWSIDLGIGYNIRDKTATVVDSGDEPYSTSTLPFVGRAVAAALKKPAETKNKFLHVAGITTTQNEVVKVLQEATGQEFKITKVRSEDLDKSAEDKIAKGDFGGAFSDSLFHYLFADGGKHVLQPEERANKLLGLADEDVKQVVVRLVKESAAK
ncbi:NAD(P)-binding protein [Sodiomyces alkalinus F11]|uniref:NAD(P)-binding protein n=1 Tax=Sodiomyces alkalinus (strain CBS 110278 / VKM F-3762 / F11) TaxID=1314773 RepID=A0A3N2PNS8_SODAK|nr:NAD(P)-binding protein [Sodiomyces alkalinus F11]ROT36178.1 NAD(P)-binding protein [Sodiomyces alkalinus F11]